MSFGSFLTRRGVVFVSILLFALHTPLAAPATAVEGAAPLCSNATVPVSEADGMPQRLTISGTLCLPDGPTPKTVQLLVHGITYDRSYWDFPYKPEMYSYVRSANAAGYATFAVDRIGSGRSSHPVSATLTLDSAAWQMHQVIQALRSGEVGPGFSNVAYVGHSLGTAIGWVESQYQDVDAWVLTDFLHGIDPFFVPNVPGQMTYPALLTPRLAPIVGADAGYLTTAPGRRGVFHNADNTDPAVIAIDEATKQTYSITEVLQVVPKLTGSDAKAVSQPTLLVVGSEDKIFCGEVAPAVDCTSAPSLVAHEAPYFGTEQLEAFVLPGGGHDINLSLNAQEWFAHAQRWLDAALPAN